MKRVDVAQGLDWVEPKVEDAVDIRGYPLSDLSRSAGIPMLYTSLWRRSRDTKGSLHDLSIELPYDMEGMTDVPRLTRLGRAPSRRCWVERAALRPRADARDIH
jgi:hypothetical protein